MVGLLWGAYILSFACSKPMHTSTDELGTIVGAAHLAGLDWRDVVRNECGYYGFGWYSFFFWLFTITDSPFLIYRTIIIMTTLLRTLIFPIAVEIARKYGCIHDEARQFVFGVLAVVLSPSSLGIISNEYPLEFFFWIVLYFFCNAVSSSGARRKAHICATVCFLSYIMTIHTRATVVVLAVVLVATLHLLVSHNYKYLPMMAAVFLCCFMIMRMLISHYQKSIWRSEGGLRNASPTFSGMFSLDSLRVWSCMIIGHITTEVVLTGGLFLFALICFIVYVNRTGFLRLFSYEEPLATIMLISILCILGVLVAFMLSGWYEGMLNTWNNSNRGVAYSYKGMVYVRYWNAFMPPFVYAALLMNEKYRRALLERRFLAVLFSVLIILYMRMVLPLIENHSSAASFLFPIGGYNPDIQISRNYYLYAICFSFTVAIVFTWMQPRHLIAALAMICIFLFSNHTRYIVEYESTIKDRMALKIDASYSLKEKLDSDDVTIGEIYMLDTQQRTDGNWRVYAIGQFYFNRHTVHYYEDNMINENDIIISTGRDAAIIDCNPGIKQYILDDNEIWYTYLDLESIVL